MDYAHTRAELERMVEYGHLRSFAAPGNGKTYDYIAADAPGAAFLETFGLKQTDAGNPAIDLGINTQTFVISDMEKTLSGTFAPEEYKILWQIFGRGKKLREGVMNYDTALTQFTEFVQSRAIKGVASRVGDTIDYMAATPEAAPFFRNLDKRVNSKNCYTFKLRTIRLPNAADAGKHGALPTFDLGDTTKIFDRDQAFGWFMGEAPVARIREIAPIFAQAEVIHSHVPLIPEPTLHAGSILHTPPAQQQSQQV